MFFYAENDLGQYLTQIYYFLEEQYLTQIKLKIVKQIGVVLEMTDVCYESLKKLKTFSKLLLQVAFFLLQVGFFLIASHFFLITSQFSLAANSFS